MNGMHLTFYGVRGSYPVSDRRMIRYGGNSSSLMVGSESCDLLLDAGTGIIGAGRQLQKKKNGPFHVHLFLTHLHIDHILGLPFCPLVYDPRYRISIYCPTPPGVDLEKSLHELFLPPYSPVLIDGIRAKIDFYSLSTEETENFSVCGLQIECRWHAHHPLQGSSIIKIQNGTSALVYATDIEIPNGMDKSLTEMIHGCDLLIHDSQYLDSDYFGSPGTYRGFGHSPVSSAVRTAQECAAKKLFLFHYDPEYTDRVLEEMLKLARKNFPETYLARESFTINI